MSAEEDEGYEEDSSGQLPEVRHKNAAGASNRRGSDRRRADISSMGVETLTKEIFKISEDMERDIGKVYRKYERLERALRAERDRKIALPPGGAKT